MKHLAFVVLLCVLCLLATCPSATAAPRLQAQSPGRDPTFEQAIYDRLAKISPDAVSVFQEATRWAMRAITRRLSAASNRF